MLIAARVRKFLEPKSLRASLAMAMLWSDIGLGASELIDCSSGFRPEDSNHHIDLRMQAALTQTKDGKRLIWIGAIKVLRTYISEEWPISGKLQGNALSNENVFVTGIKRDDSNGFSVTLGRYEGDPETRGVLQYNSSNRNATGWDRFGEFKIDCTTSPL